MGTVSTHAWKGEAVTDFPQLTAEQLKAMSGVDPAITKWFMIIAGIVTVVQTISGWINTAKTKKNTVANDKTAGLLQESSPAEIGKAKQEAVEAIKRATEENVAAINQATDEIKNVATMTRVGMQEELKDFKLKVMRLHEENRKNLSGIPKVGDAINQMQQRIGQAELSAKKSEKKLDQLLEGLDRIRKKDG